MPEAEARARSPAPGRGEDSIDFGPVGQTLGFLLRLAQLEAFREFFDAFEGREAIRPGEATVLLLIEINPGIRQGVLAKALMIKRAHMTKMVRAMEEAGLVERTVPEDDRRSIELHLTGPGRAQLDRFRDHFLGHEVGAESRLTPRERAELRRLLRKFLAL